MSPLQFPPRGEMTPLNLLFMYTGMPIYLVYLEYNNYYYSMQLA